MTKHIYIADDQENIRNLMKSFLEAEGFSVICFSGGQDLVLAFEQTPCDLVILDIMMPKGDGLVACAALRQKSAVPIIFVSAKDSELDRITGISIGGDDYMVKPFSPLELVARVKGIFRRIDFVKHPPQSENTICYGDISLFPKLRIAQRKEDTISVTPTEFDFLFFMMRNHNRAVGKTELLKEVWQFDYEVDTRVADDLVKRLRKKLKEIKSNVQIDTVWGFGYRLLEETQ